MQSLLPAGPPIEANPHNTAKAAYLAAQAVEKAGGVILLLGYGSVMSQEDALRSLPHRAAPDNPHYPAWQQWWASQQRPFNDSSLQGRQFSGRVRHGAQRTRQRAQRERFHRELGEIGAYLDPTPVWVEGMERVLIATSAAVQPAPPEPTRLWLPRDEHGVKSLDAYFGLMTTMGVQRCEGAILEGTVQAISALEMAKLATREKNYKAEWLDPSQIHGVPHRIAGRPVFVMTWMPLQRAIDAYNEHPEQVKSTIGYSKTVFNAAAHLGTEMIDGHLWGPASELERMLSSHEIVDVGLSPLDAALLARINRDGSPELRKYANAIATRAGQLENTLDVSLEEYLSGSVEQLPALGVRIPGITRALAAVAPGLERVPALA